MSDRSASPDLNNYEHVRETHYETLEEVRDRRDSSRSRSRSRSRSPSPKRADSPAGIPNARPDSPVARPDSPAKPRSRSPSPKSRSRSPSPKPRSRSPSPKSRSRSPSPKLGTPPPSPKQRSRSPSPKRRSPSPRSPKQRSRSPSPKPRSRSPSPVERAKSPELIRADSPDGPLHNAHPVVNHGRLDRDAPFEAHRAFHDAGQKVGLDIWRIEQFEPVKQSIDGHGTFNSGDCYIVLSTKTRPGSNRFNYDLHFWLGVDCSQDEAGSVAMRTVELDEAVFGGSAVQYREVQGHESKMFLSYFKKNIRYLGGGVESGFRHVDSDNYEKRLFQVKGKKNIRIAEVPCKCGSLNQGDTFVLLTQQNIFVWIGPKSTDKEKTSGLMYARRARDEEYGGQAHIHVVEDWNSNTQFFRALGSHDKAIKAADEHDDEDIIRKLDQATLLYEIYDDQHVREIGVRPLRQSMLDHEKCYILDSGPTGMFLWTGRKSGNDLKRSCWRRVQEFMHVRGYPHYLSVVRVVDGAETPLFQQYFDDWEDVLPGSPQADDKRIADQDYDGVEDVNIKDMHRRANKTEEWMPDDGSGTMHVWRIEDRELIPVPEKALGVFFGGDCYVVHYTYSGDSHIIYFWQGIKSTTEEKGAAALHATLLDESLGGKAVQIRVVQHKEPTHFLKLFRGRLVYFMGGHIRGFRSLRDYEDFDPRQAHMFQVRGSDNTMRAMQVPSRAASLNANDVFIVDSEKKTFVWIGKYSSKEELKAARRMLKFMSPDKGDATVIEEDRESGLFWHVLGGEEKYYRGRKKANRGISILPRIFHCSMTSGKFTVEEIVDFTQEDLQEGDVMLLDTFDEIFIWIGKGAKEFEKRESYKTARAYLQVDPSGRTSENTLIIVVKQGFEPPQFSGCFPAWDIDKWSKGQTFQELIEDLGRENAGINLLAKEIEKYTSFYEYEELRRRSPPEGVDPSKKEMYLSDEDFVGVFGFDKDHFRRLPEWKRVGLKKQHSLF